MLFFNRLVYFARWDIGALHAACAAGSTGSGAVDLALKHSLLGLSSSSTHERQKEPFQHKTIPVLSPLKLFVCIYVFADFFLQLGSALCII